MIIETGNIDILNLLINKNCLLDEALGLVDARLKNSSILHLPLLLFINETVADQSVKWLLIRNVVKLEVVFLLDK
jgi:hypothetical protein